MLRTLTRGHGWAFLVSALNTGALRVPSGKATGSLNGRQPPGGKPHPKSHNPLQSQHFPLPPQPGLKVKTISSLKFGPLLGSWEGATQW